MADLKLLDPVTPQNRAMFAERFLEKYLNPAMGTMTKVEIDLLVFSLLHEIGFVSKGELQYEIARKLHITTARVRALTMQMQLRDVAETEGALRSRLIECFGSSQFVKEGKIIQFGIEDPLLREFAVMKLKKVGATADSSFNREIVRIQLDAFVVLVQELMPSDRFEVVHKALVKAGMADSSPRAVLLGALQKLGEKVAGSAGEAFAQDVVDSAGPAIKELFSAGASGIVKRWKGLVGGSDGSSSETTEV